MVTGKSPERLPLARLAVQAFRRQTYTNAELLILNDGIDRVAPVGTPGVRELFVTRGCPLGELRNMAFERAEGDWLLQWDDDDWYHEQRIEYMVAGVGQACAATLHWQVRCDVRTGTAYYYRGRANEGIHGTILHRRDVTARYPHTARGEDTAFLHLLGPIQVLDNRPAAGYGADAGLYVRFHHGHNTWGVRHIMRGHSACDGRSELLSSHQHCLDVLLPEYRRAVCFEEGTAAHG